MKENDDDATKMLDSLDSPLDPETIYMMLPTEEMVASLCLSLNVVVGTESMTVLSPSEDFSAILATMCVRAFLLGYIAAKMEQGEM